MNWRQISTSAVCALLLFPSSGDALGKGQFIGRPIAKWESDGRSMTLVESFEFRDGNNRSWRVPSGTRIDGASIPKIFWPLIGGPFEGKYRDASVIHDYFCDNKRRPWREVHKVFYDAMLASGVSSSKAYVMYQAVVRFGPRWEEPIIDPKCLLPNGKFDFERCTVNSGMKASKTTYPQATSQDLEAFADDMKSVASPEDLAILKRLAETTRP